MKKGHRVAICEQVEDPKKAKGVVRREVVRVVSPGTLADAGYLDAREPAFLLAVTGLDDPPGPQLRLGVSLLDLSTGEFQVAEYTGLHARQALDDDVAVLDAARDRRRRRRRRDGGAAGRGRRSR